MRELVLFLAQVQQPEGPPLQPLPHPEFPEPMLMPPGTEWWVYAGAALLVVLLLALVVWLLLRPAKALPVQLPQPWSKAMNRLRDILVRATVQPPAQTAGEVSEALRRYFMERYQIPAPARTSQELFQRRGIPATSQRLQKYELLADLWDQLSFAPVPADHSAAAALVQKAISHLEEDRS